MWSIVIWIVVIVGVIISIALMRRECRKTEAMRQATCIIMGLPQDTPMKEFKRMHK